MNCRSCNTPVSSRNSSCPNCGRNLKSNSFIDQAPVATESEEAAEPLSLSPSMAIESDVNETTAERLSRQKLPARTRRASENKKAAEGSKKPAQARKPVAAKAEPASDSTPKIDPMMLRALIVEQPELLEPGLQPVLDDAGREVGVRFSSEVGTIDLLAKDSNDAFVVVMIPETGCEDTLIADVLRRVGWVRKHLVKQGEDVRGIVVLAELDDDLAYAAAAVSDTIRFKSYALSLSLVDLNV